MLTTACFLCVLRFWRKNDAGLFLSTLRTNMIIFGYSKHDTRSKFIVCLCSRLGWYGNCVNTPTQVHFLRHQHKFHSVASRMLEAGQLVPPTMRKKRCVNYEQMRTSGKAKPRCLIVSITLMYARDRGSSNDSKKEPAVANSVPIGRGRSGVPNRSRKDKTCLSF